MLAAVLVVLAASAPEAAPATTAPQAPPAATAKTKEQMICKTEQVTGSRFTHKVCYSKAEYEAKQRLQQEQLREGQSSGLQRQ